MKSFKSLSENFLKNMPPDPTVEEAKELAEALSIPELLEIAVQHVENEIHDDSFAAQIRSELQKMLKSVNKYYNR